MLDFQGNRRGKRFMQFRKVSLKRSLLVQFWKYFEKPALPATAGHFESIDLVIDPSPDDTIQF
jgi:hypothetical protein